MSKIHKKTGSSCIICDEPIIYLNKKRQCVIFHKTRRQTHSTCIECALYYLEPILEIALSRLKLNIKNETNVIKCPGSYHGILRNKCNCRLLLQDIILPESKLSLDIFRITYILANANTYLCPEKNCGSIVEVDIHYTSNRLHCASCKTAWCKHCLLTPYHNDKSCIEAEAETKQTENGKCILDMKAKGLLKFCPQCKIPCIKNDGCNKMKCVQCNNTWCWLCVKSNIDYDHYNSSLAGSCTGKLWEGVDLNNNNINIVNINNDY